MRVTAAFLLGLAGLAFLAWASGAGEQLGWWAREQQRAFKNALAGAVQGLRAGEPLALWSL